MKRKTAKHKFRKNFFSKWLAAVLISGFLLLMYLSFRQSPDWSSSVSYGNITGPIIKYKDSLIYGTGYSKLYFMDTIKIGNTRSLDLNTGDVLVQTVKKGKVVAISGDTIWISDIKAKKVLWQYAAPSQAFFERAIIHKKLVIASNKDGCLYVLDLKNGNLVWKFTPEALTDLSSVLIAGNLHYFGDFIAAQNRVYVSSRDGNFYALGLARGNVVWKTAMGEVMGTGPEHFGKFLYVTGQSGKTFALDRESGKILWETSESSPAKCSKVFSSYSLSENLFHKALTFVNDKLRDQLSIGPLLFFELHENGTAVGRNGKTGESIWITDNINDAGCPSYYGSSAIFSSKHGDVTSISLNNGFVNWKVSEKGQILSSGRIVPKHSFFTRLQGKILEKDLYVFGNTQGEVEALEFFSGKSLWKFNAIAPVTSRPVPSRDKLLIPVSDGVIYRISRNGGKAVVSKSSKNFEIVETTQTVGGKEIHEFTLKSEVLFENPWRQADFGITFTNDSKTSLKIPGFYYGDNMWKVRFNPPQKGTWQWTAFWSPHGDSLTKKGSFEAVTDTSDFFVRLNQINPKRLTVDGKNIFNGIGIGDTILDYNYTGSPLDDWATGETKILETRNQLGNLKNLKSGKFIDLEEYLKTYGKDGAGFNLFRWSLLNASGSQFRELQFPTVYSIHEGKIGDGFAESLRNNGFHIYLTIFGFDVPYKFSENPNERFLLASYIKYLYARYGAYVDIWELANETTIPDNITDFLAETIRSFDYEKRPISISFEKPQLSNIDIISPHWYENEDITKSDITTVEQIEKFAKVAKPVVFGEQGNKITNFDETSAQRMRIRSWTSFFREGVLVFWNQSNRKDFKPLLPSANLYIGPEERGYIRSLQNFSSGFPLDTAKFNFEVGPYGVRGYGLKSDKVIAGYFVNASKPSKPAKFSLTLYPEKKGRLEWSDPASGKILSSVECAPGSFTVTSPNFSTDISFKLMYNN